MNDPRTKENPLYISAYRYYWLKELSRVADQMHNEGIPGIKGRVDWILLCNMPEYYPGCYMVVEGFDELTDDEREHALTINWRDILSQPIKRYDLL